MLLGTLAPRMLRVAGEVADGTVTWMANRLALEEHVVPRTRAAARPRLVVPLRASWSACRSRYTTMYRTHATMRRVSTASTASCRTTRVFRLGGLERSADACIVGDDDSVAAQLRALVDAGATDVWAAIFPVGDDRKAWPRTDTTPLLQNSGSRRLSA